MQKNLWSILLFGTWTTILIFFVFFYKYHFYFIEESRLFLLDKDFLQQYFGKPGFLSCFLGDFLTQFYYLRAGGPFVISITLLVLAVVVRKLFSSLVANWLSVLISILLVVFHAFLHCNLNYPLSATISFLLVFIIILGYKRISNPFIRAMTAFILFPLSYFLVGGYFILFPVFIIWIEVSLKTKMTSVIFSAVYGLFIVILLPLGFRQVFKLTASQAYLFPNIYPVSFKPDLKLELMLGLDYEWYHHHPERVIKMAQECNFHNRVISYYYNMAQASIGQLPNHLMDFYQPGTYGLFIPLETSQNYFNIGFANEVYFLTGDVNAAQHCAMLGSTFSPVNAAPRFMTRVVEANIINGEYEVAKKYLKILEQTLFHKRWAIMMQKYLNVNTANQYPWIYLKRQQLVHGDYIRPNPNDFTGSLKHLIQDHPDNLTARDYLLCYYLLDKDIQSFYKVMQVTIAKQAGFALPALYQQALLIYFANHPNDPTRNQFHFSRDIFDSFINYSEMFAKSNGNGSVLQNQYGKTYWFYYHYAVLKNNEGKL